MDRINNAEALNGQSEQRRARQSKAGQRGTFGVYTARVLLVTMIALVSSFGLLTGCANDTNNGADGSLTAVDDGANKTVVNLLRVDSDGLNDEWENAAEAYMSANSDVVINIEDFDSWDDYGNTLANRVQGARTVVPRSQNSQGAADQSVGEDQSVGGDQGVAENQGVEADQSVEEEQGVVEGQVDTSMLDVPTICVLRGRADVEKYKGRLEDLSGEDWVKDANKDILKEVRGFGAADETGTAGGADTTNDTGTTNGAGTTGEEGAIDAHGNANSKVYAMPVNVCAYGFAYNREMFEAAGIDATTLVTFDELKRAVEVLNGKINNGELKSEFPMLEAVFEFPCKDMSEYATYMGSLALHGDAEDSEKLAKMKRIDFKEKDGLKQILDLQAAYTANGTDTAKLLDVEYDDAIKNGIADERVAIVAMKNSDLNAVKAENEEVAAKLGMFAIPMKGSSEGKMLVGADCYFGVYNAASEEQRAAAKGFLNWLVTSDEGKSIVVNKMNYVPAFSSFDAVTSADGVNKDVQRYVNEGKIVPTMHTSFPADWGVNKLGVGLQSYLTGDNDFDTMVQDVKNAWGSMMAAM